MSSKVTAKRVLGVLVALLSALFVAASTSLAVPNKPDLALALAPVSQSIVRGTTATYAVTLTSVNGFAGAVALTASGLPGGATATFTPASVTLTASGTGSTATVALAVATASATPIGSSALTITGASGKVSSAITATLVVNAPVTGSLGITASPSTLTVQPGSAAAYGLMLVRTNVPGPVTFTVTGAPSGVTASTSPNPTSGTTATVTVSTTLTTADGSYPLVVSASGVDSGGVTRAASVTITLVVSTKGFPFTIAGTPAGLLAPGLTRTVDLAISNPNNKAISIVGLSVSIGTITRTPAAIAAGLGCTAADYTTRQFSGAYPLVIPASATRTLSQLGVTAGQLPAITMLDRPLNQDGCKGATITLGYAGSGQGL